MWGLNSSTRRSRPEYKSDAQTTEPPRCLFSESVKVEMVATETHGPNSSFASLLTLASHLQCCLYFSGFIRHSHSFIDLSKFRYKRLNLTWSMEVQFCDIHGLCCCFYVSQNDMKLPLEKAASYPKLVGLL